MPNLPEFQMVVLALTASTSVRKQLAKQKKIITLFTSTFRNLSINILVYSHRGSLENGMHTNFFLEDTYEGLE